MYVSVRHVLAGGGKPAELNFKPGADSSCIFFRGKWFSAENSVEFVAEMIFQNFFLGKFWFFPTFFGGKFSAEFSPEKMYKKSAPGANPTTYEFTTTTPAW
jgi:hypothetical protein